MTHQSDRTRSRRLRGLQVALCLLALLPLGSSSALIPVVAYATTLPELVHPEKHATATDLEGWRHLRTLMSEHEAAKAASAGQDDFDVQRYEIVFFPDFTSLSLSGQVGVEFVANVDGLAQIQLDLYDNLQVSNVSDEQGPLVFAHSNDLLSIPLRSPLAQGDRARVTVSYGGQPQPAGFMGFQFNQKYGRPILATLSEPFYARSWWPCKDVPTDKAEVALGVLVPEAMFAASNGELIGQTNTGAGQTFYQWEENYPISTYNVSLAIAEYTSWTEDYLSPGGANMRLSYHVFPEDYDAARIDFERTSQILDLYAGLFGEYPFINDKYGMAEFVWEGAMEHQTMTSYGDFFLTGDKFYERIIGHELAHQWWGNLMTVSDWDEIWLHEGFATYCEALWLESIQGETAYHDYMWQHSNNCCGFPGPIVPPNKLFNSTVYFKGAWVLHMLRHLIGDNDFFQSMKDLAERRQAQYGNLTTQDVIDQFESSSQIEISWFFDQWLYREGRPDFRYQWSSSPDGGRYRLDLTIDQIQSGPAYVTPIDLRIDTVNGPVDDMVWVASPSQKVSLFLASEPQSITLDPDRWLLHWAQAAPSATPNAPAPVSTRLALLPNRPNPFNPRTLLRFELPTPTDVTLRILDVRGRVVDILRPGNLGAGVHELPWNGTDQYGEPVASGSYQVQLIAPGALESQKILLVK